MLRREQALAEAAGDPALLEQLHTDYEYAAVQTCAVDGMCATACPVNIDTGDLVKRLRAEKQGAFRQAGWRTAATHWAGTLGTTSLGLDVAAVLPSVLPRTASQAARAVAGTEHVPRWDESLPAGGSRRRPRPQDSPDAVYVPSCHSSMFAPAGGSGGIVRAVLELAERAGLRLAVPDGIADVCCGTPWSSKGLVAGQEAMAARVRPWPADATRDGELPVVSDSATCTEGWARTVTGTHVRVLDAVAWVAAEVLPRLPEGARLASLALQPTCSSTRAGLDAPLRQVAAAVADEVFVPPTWGCCGFAGDRGILQPGAHRLGHPAAGRRGDGTGLRRLRLGQPDVRDRHVAGDGARVRAAAGAARPRHPGGTWPAVLSPAPTSPAPGRTRSSVPAAPAVPPRPA